jgi:hypothetical protein
MVDRLEATLEALQQLREDPSSEASVATLRRVLAGKSSHAAAKAGEIAGEFELSELVPDLEGAFLHFMQSPVRRDPGCRAKGRLCARCSSSGTMMPISF